MQFRVRVLSWAAVFAVAASADEFRLRPVDATGQIHWSGAFTAGVCTVETAGTPTGPWVPRENYFTTNSAGGARVRSSPGNTFCRLLAVDLSTNTPLHHANLLGSYGTLETIAGTNLPGGGTDGFNYWRAEYEGGPATNACLSRPHIAFADPDNNLLIVDQGSDSVLKVTTDGRIHTYAGTHVRGFNGYEGWATNIQLNLPNGGWMRDDGTFYILDTENNLIRRVATNGHLTTLVTNADTGTLHDGRGLWVKSDESVVYWCALTMLRRWTPSEGVVTLPQVFVDLANLVGDERTGDLYLCDRGQNRVFRRSTNGVLTTLAGNGSTAPRTEGTSVLQFGFNRPRDIWFIPNGGYFICEHSPGNCVWFVDPENKVHRWLNGSSANNAYHGDGQWFYTDPATAKISKPRSVVTDQRGNIIVVENDIGFVRRISFHRLTP